VKLNPDFAQAHENLGSSLARSGQLPAAIEQFEAAIQIDPGYVVARNNLGFALAQSGRIPEAIEQFQQVLQIDPDNASARQNLIKLQAFKSAPATK
jgi:tetratricopeptide (TPR) repeat protein